MADQVLKDSKQVAELEKSMPAKLEEDSSSNLKSAYIEAVLFSVAKPMSLEGLADIFEVSQDTMAQAVEAYGKELEACDRGLRIRKSGAGIELVTAPDCGTYLQKVRRKEDKQT